MLPSRVPHCLHVALLATATLLASGDQSYGDEMLPRILSPAQSAGCRRCCHTSRGDVSAGMSSDSSSECAQAYNGKPGICVGHAQDRCCPGNTSAFNESTESCSFDPFTPCVRDTGGSCTYFTCSSLREAAQCVGGKCLCRPGYCSVNGVCVNNCNKDLGRVDDGLSNFADPAPDSTCWWSHAFLGVFGFHGSACSWPLNNYGRSVCRFDDNELRDGMCFPDGGKMVGEEACWLGTATNGSINQFAYKCERNTGKAFPLLGCTYSGLLSCGGNATCDARGRCMCAATDCSVNGNCMPLEMQYMPERVERLADNSTVNNPLFWVVVVCVSACCCSIICQSETLQLTAYWAEDADKNQKQVTIDLDHWKVANHDDKEHKGKRISVQLDDLGGPGPLTITLEESSGNGKRLLCDQQHNVDRWQEVITMVEAFGDRRE